MFSIVSKYLNIFKFYCDETAYLVFLKEKWRVGELSLEFKEGNRTMLFKN